MTRTPPEHQRQRVALQHVLDEPLGVGTVLQVRRREKPEPIGRLLRLGCLLDEGLQFLRRLAANRADEGRFFKWLSEYPSPLLGYGTLQADRCVVEK